MEYVVFQSQLFQSCSPRNALLYCPAVSILCKSIWIRDSENHYLCYGNYHWSICQYSIQVSSIVQINKQVCSLIHWQIDQEVCCRNSLSTNIISYLQADLYTHISGSGFVDRNYQLILLLHYYTSYQGSFG